MTHNWQRADWLSFRYDLTAAQEDLQRFADKAGQVSGLMRGLPEGAQSKAVLDVMISEAIKTSEIEGERLSRPDVASPIRNQLGWNAQREPVADLASKGGGGAYGRRSRVVGGTSYRGDAFRLAPNTLSGRKKGFGWLLANP